MYAAVIVENRKLPKKVIDRHLRYLPGYDLIVYDKHNVKTLHDYNLLMTSLEFWQKLEKYKRVLIFQHDSGLLRAGIERFYQWDYVGAPWPFQEHGGNGGLSLRNPKAMIKTINEVAYNGWNEDVYFSNNLKGNLAPRSECIKFSVESEYVLGTLAYHFGNDSKRYLTDVEINKILTQYD